MGTPPQITLCLERLNDYVQQEVESDDFLAYAAGVSFGEASSARSPEREPRGGRGGGGGSWRDGPGGGGGGHRWEGGWRDDHRDGGSGDRWESGGGGYHQNGGYGGGGGGRGRSRSRERGGSWASEVPRSVRDAVGLLGQAVGALPPGAAEMPYSISLEVPSSTVGAVMGRSGEFVKSVEESCHVNVDIDRTEGGGEDAGGSDQDQLRRQITDLQETLARLTGGAKGGGGGGAGSGETIVHLRCTCGGRRSSDTSWCRNRSRQRRRLQRAALTPAGVAKTPYETDEHGIFLARL